MSAVEEENTRKRPIRNNRHKKETSADADAASPVEEKKERVVREVVPLPADKVGSTLEGTIVSINVNKASFGFLSANEFADASNIYFRPTFLRNEDGSRVFLRRGYQVTFKLAVDDQNRQIATEIALTAEGEKSRVEREAHIKDVKEQRKANAEGEDAPAEKEIKEPRKRSTRKPRVKATATAAAEPEVETAATAPAETEVKKEKKERPARKSKPQHLVTLSFSVDNGTTKFPVEVDLNSSISRLLSAVAKVHGARVEGSFYVNGEYLTHAVLKTLTDKDVIVAGPKREKAAEETA